MRKGLWGSIGVLLTSASFTFAQSPFFPQGGTAEFDDVPVAALNSEDEEPDDDTNLSVELLDLPKTAAEKDEDNQTPATPFTLDANNIPTCDNCIFCVRCCPKPPRFWGGADYLLWWYKPGPVTLPLVTTGTLDSFGLLGRPGTEVLFGGSHLNYDTTSGFRATAGAWLDRCAKVGVETSGFVLEDRGIFFRANGDAAGNPVLTRPAFNVLDGAAAGALISFPDAFAGGVAVSSRSQLWGIETNGVINLCRKPKLTWDLLVGFRYLDLDESLHIEDSSRILADGIAGFNGVPVTAGVIGTQDRFDARSQFYGGQIGNRFSFFLNDWLQLSWYNKVALGGTHQSVNAFGTTALTLPDGQTGVLPGALLTASSNIGRRTADQFAVVPEVGVNVNVRFCRWASASMGYSFLYWNNVVRPGAQIDPFVNPNLIPTALSFGAPGGPARPAPRMESSDFWAHGLNCGLRLSY
ncbi:MAG: BBP7 family outer membrane beta-barrel protein [Gemmataceae bacterium]